VAALPGHFLKGPRLAATMTKVGFVGAGTIGANSIFATLAMTDRIDEVAVVDVVEASAVGRALDLNTASVAFGRRTASSAAPTTGS
jgi:malate/lactate dehydrogenase